MRCADTSISRSIEAVKRLWSQRDEENAHDQHRELARCKIPRLDASAAPCLRQSGSDGENGGHQSFQLRRLGRIEWSNIRSQSNNEVFDEGHNSHQNTQSNDASTVDYNLSVPHESGCPVYDYWSEFAEHVSALRCQYFSLLSSCQ